MVVKPNLCLACGCWQGVRCRSGRMEMAVADTFFFFAGGGGGGGGGGFNNVINA